MAHSSWGAPCKGTIKTLVRPDGLKLPIRLEILELVALLIDETERLGYDIIPGWTWGNSCRKIRNSNNWSNHAWGLAVDLNAPENPMGPRTGRIRKYPSVIALWKKYGFYWGGDYSSRADDMHFEFIGSVTDAKRQTVNAKMDLAKKSIPTVVVPIPAPSEMNIKPEDLLAQFDRAIKQWPFIESMERKHDLPKFLLFALGSRETNLQNIKNKDGSDIGVWQRNKINGHPVGYMEDIPAQADWSAEYLKKQIDRFGLLGGVNAYNSGQPETEKTAGKDYGPDVLARRSFLIQMRGNEEEAMRYIFSVKSKDKTLDGIWEMGSDEVARHIPEPKDVNALKFTLGLRDLGTLSEEWLKRHKRIHPDLEDNLS